MPAWVFYTLLTVLLWGAWGVVNKPLSDVLNVWEAQVMALAGSLPVVLYLWRRTRLEQADADQRTVAISFGAGVLGGIGNMALFQAMAAGGKAATVVPLTSLYPIATVGLAFIFLRERPNGMQALGIGFSLAALWLFNVKEESGMWSAWLVFSLIPIVCWGIGGFVQKFATLHISPERCTLAFLLGFMPLGLAVLFIPSRWSELPVSGWTLGALAGFLLALGNLTVTLAYGKGGRALIVTPASGLYMLVTVPLAVAALGESVAEREKWGIAMAVVAVILLCQETKLAEKENSAATTVR